MAAARKGTNADDMPPLQKLILEQMHRRSWSPAQVEERGIKHATLHRYMQRVELRTMPRESTLKELAAALDLDEHQVRDAAYRSMAANRGSRDSVGEAAPVARARQGGPVLPLEGLTEEQQEHLRRTAEIFRSQNPKAGP